MKANETPFLDFLRNSRQLVIPPYQRAYCWTERQCRRLWDDIIEVGESTEGATHFIGSIIYVEQDYSQITHRSPHLVIDGQQRLTTVTLLLEALARTITGAEAPEGFSPRQIRRYYLYDHLLTDDRRFRLLLTEDDRESLLALVRQQPLPQNHAGHIGTNFAFFERQVKSLGDARKALCRGLERLVMVDIALLRGTDHPQRIFESMNATGRGLVHADLIRNFMLMDLTPEDQERIHRLYLRPVETGFGHDPASEHFDLFMRHYLAMKTGEVPRSGTLYETFKDHANTRAVREAGIAALAEDLRDCAGHYRAMAMEEESNPVLAPVFRDMTRLGVDTAYPFLLALYRDHADGLLDEAEFRTVLVMVTSYIVRRTVCGMPGRVHGPVFAAFSRILDRTRYLASVKAHFLNLPAGQRFPHDSEFHNALVTRDLYSLRRGRAILDHLENHGRRERMSLEDLSIEHILPQTRNLSPAWKNALGPAWQGVQEQWVHTLGNLTLSAYNTEIADRPFAEKRDMKGGYRDSPLRLNAALREARTWNEEAIVARGHALADQALAIWPLPCLAADERDIVRYRPGDPGSYRIEDHPCILPGAPMHDLFEALRRAILDLDSGVYECPRRHYIAYKGSTNIVDIVPQKTRLQLTLNTRFRDLDDPAGLATDCTNRHFWGNGDALVMLEDRRQIPYVMELVRQVFNRQMHRDASKHAALRTSP